MLRANQRFTRLVLQSKSSKSGYWHCICTCGKQTEVRGAHLTSGAIKSCGCYARDRTRTDNYKHGLASRDQKISVELSAYYGARKRCNNPKSKDFYLYGGRGIKFLFKNFQEWFEALGLRPSPALSVDRIDPDGHYETGNVRWATAKQQRLNQRMKIISNETPSKTV